MIGIRHLDYYLPSEMENVENVIAQLSEFELPSRYQSVKEYASKYTADTGIIQIPVEKDGDTVDICCNLAEKAIDTSNIATDRIKYIIHIDHYNSGMSKDGSYIAHYIQEKFKCRKATAFSLFQECTSTIVAMSMAKYVLKDQDDCMLIISTNFLKNANDRFAPFSIGGDAAGVALLQNNENTIQIIDGAMRSNGQLSHNLHHGLPNKSIRLNDIHEGISLVHELLNRNDLTPERLNVFIPQNMNITLCKKIYPRLLSISANKIFADNIAKHGHLGDVDTIKNLKDYFDTREHDTKENVVFYGVGGTDAYISWATMLLR